ncbi:CBS domain-containing protein [Sphingopyxis sp. SE2]|jgi:CBS domain-containing protein|uniref:CBS domain-containing protein n=1 Tax=unclassified Sphingopyxis TaxID=2614943 RepID=UPI00050F4CA3|nr:MULTISPECIES: CBS domain-containing protein [unclassified Sphingopyxis]KGB55115.1 CBS domain-containing putative signal-transduction protein [Sphingopyxis sp. LC363]MDT7529548.1 CBS domain-containing protein [Sphingopyxis sp. SE2]
MTIGAILRERTGAVISARPGDAVRAVIDLLAQNRIGAVPVLEGDMVVGIFSERDIVRLLSSYGPDALDRSLDEVMTKSPVTCDSDMAVIGALSQMTQKRIRHLPVVHGGKMVGFVSIGDLVKYRIDKIEAEAAAMRDYIAS